MGGQLQSPDFEVIVRVNASDAAIAAGFLTSEDEFDVVVGITEVSHLDRICELLSLVLAGFNAANWVSVDDYDLSEAVADEDSDDDAL